MMRITLTILVTLLLATPIANALETVKVTENVYALVGELGQRSPSNHGNNATFGVVITSAGVVLIDSGSTPKGAQQIDEAIHKLTDKPVVAVINTGGQDHRWLANSYFSEKGARIIASVAAVEDQHKRLSEELNGLAATLGDAIASSCQPVYADERFKEQLDFTIGGVDFILRRVGPAHTPGDSYVWLPQSQVVFTGDVVYVERMLGIFPFSSSRNWLTAFKSIESLSPKYIVPGHGHPTTLEKARRDTYDYLTQLRSQIGQLISDGGGMEDAGKIDQSQFSYLKVYDELKGRNAQQVYSEMEWE